MPIRVRVGQAPAVKVVSSLSGSKTISLSGLNDVSANNPQNCMVWFITPLYLNGKEHYH